MPFELLDRRQVVDRLTTDEAMPRPLRNVIRTLVQIVYNDFVQDQRS